MNTKAAHQHTQPTGCALRMQCAPRAITSVSHRQQRRIAFALRAPLGASSHCVANLDAKFAGAVTISHAAGRARVLRVHPANTARYTLPAHMSLTHAWNARRADSNRSLHSHTATLVPVAVSAIRPLRHSQHVWHAPIAKQGDSNLPQGRRRVRHVLRARIAQPQEPNRRWSQRARCVPVASTSLLKLKWRALNVPQASTACKRWAL